MAKPVKVHFFPRSDSPESAWCVPLSKPHQYRLDNILFLHPAPAYGDVIEAREGAAADAGDLAAIKRAKPAELGKVNEAGHSLLYIAAREGRTELVKELLKRGASPNPKKKGELAPLHATAMRDRPREAELLLEAGAKIELAKDRDGDPLLVLAAFRESANVLPVLLRTKPPVDVLSQALLEAAGVGNVKLCKLLLKAGADPDLKTSKNNSARSVARARKRREVLALF